MQRRARRVYDRAAMLKLEIEPKILITGTAKSKRNRRTGSALPHTCK